MLTKTRYSFFDVIRWTRIEIIAFLIFFSFVGALYGLLELSFLVVPWTPVALIGTAVAFMVGFQNNSAYGRIWEARKIWGGIVNVSRTWGMQVQAMVGSRESKELHRILIHRHIAWLTTLRHAMREPRNWEVFEKHWTNREWSKKICIPERVGPLEDTLKNYLSNEDLEYVLSKPNKSSAVLYLQSHHLRKLKEENHLWEFSFLELEQVLGKLFDLQGKSERIKNFPYPRQYATLSHLFIWTFLVLLPFGIIPEFARLGTQLQEKFPELAPHFFWLGVPFCLLISWIFHTMDRIGRVGENPFEGSANDVPISTIARGIEIDLRNLLDENPENIPEQFPEQYHVQM